MVLPQPLRLKMRRRNSLWDYMFLIDTCALEILQVGRVRKLTNTIHCFERDLFIPHYYYYYSQAKTF